MTATADYGVSIVEDFTPPKDMTPGQTVNKDVSVVNTGSVDAFARVKFDNSVTFTRKTSQVLTTDISAGKTYFLDPATGSIANPSGTDMTGTAPALNSATAPAGQTYLYDLRTFTAPVAPVAEAGTTLVKLNPYEKLGSDGKTIANEVSTLMAGGRVVVAESTAVAPDAQLVRSGDDINGGSNGTGNGFAVIYESSTHKYVAKVGSDWKELQLDQNGYYEVKSNANAADYASVTVVGLARDYSGTGKYALAGDGLYIFKRYTTIPGATVSAVEHSGFYYWNGEFYALKTKLNGVAETPYLDATITYETAPNNTDIVSGVSGVELVSTQSFTSQTENFTMDLYDDTNGLLSSNYNTADYMLVTHHVSTDADTTKDIKFKVDLYDSWSDSWTYVPATVASGAGYFYYNYKLTRCAIKTTKV